MMVYEMFVMAVGANLVVLVTGGACCTVDNVGCELGLLSPLLEKVGVAADQVILFCQ